MIKTKTGIGGANSALALTITSPNTKYIRIYGWEISMIGSNALAADVTFEIEDEDGNVLWATSLQRAIANANANALPYSYIPPRPIFIPTGKNAVIRASAGGANTQIRVTVMYDA